MRPFIHITLGLALLLAACSGPQPADYVNPFIGASTSIAKAGVLHGLGKTFPGATTPWGMVQVSCREARPSPSRLRTILRKTD